MDKLGIFFFAVLIISAITQTYSAPPIGPRKPLDLSVYPRVESLRADVPKDLRNEVLGSFKEYSVSTSFETKVRPIEVFPSNPEILRPIRPKPSDDHVHSSSRTSDNSNVFHFSPLDLSVPKKKPELFPRLQSDSSLRSGGKTIDIFPSKPEVQFGETSLPRPSSSRVDDLLKPGEISNGFHFSATNSLAYSRKRTKSSLTVGQKEVSAKSGSPKKKVRNNEESTLNSETGLSQLVNVDKIFTTKTIPAIDSNGKAVFLEFYSFNTEAGPKDMMYVPQAVRHAYYDAGIFETVFRTPDGREFEWKTFAKPWLNSEQGFLSGDLFGESPQNPLKVTVPIGDGLFRSFEVPREVRDTLGNYAKWYEDNLIEHYHGKIPGTIKNNDRSASNVVFKESFPPNPLQVGYNKYKMPAFDSNGKTVLIDVLIITGPTGFHSEMITVPESLKLEYWRAGIYKTTFSTADGRQFEWKSGEDGKSRLKQVYNLGSSGPNLSF